MELDIEQDRIIMYNEIITVMKSLLMVFQQKQHKKLINTKQLIDKLTMDTLLETALVEQERLDLRFENQPTAGDEPGTEEGYSMHKSLIKNAWIRFRPV